MRLSILIASIVERYGKLTELLGTLSVDPVPGVEILTMIDNRERTIGDKKNRLLAGASGDYVCWIDDDDNIPVSFARKMVQASKSDPDCIGFWGRIVNGNKSARVQYAMGNSVRRDGDDFIRPIWFMNPVKRSIALQTGWPDKNYTEDGDYARGIEPHLKQTVFIDEIMYTYNCRDPF